VQLLEKYSNGLCELNLTRASETVVHIERAFLRPNQHRLRPLFYPTAYIVYKSYKNQAKSKIWANWTMILREREIVSPLFFMLAIRSWLDQKRTAQRAPRSRVFKLAS